jgi:hypothetical protein
MTSRSKNKYYEFVVSLVGADPPAYRRFLLNKNSSFNHLHSAIQMACGWEDRHLFHFSFENPYEELPPLTSVFAISGWDEPSTYIGSPDFARDVRLSFCFEDNLSTPVAYYTYDFGDGWVHEIQHVATHVFGARFKQLLIAGARSFPKEDCGGLAGYGACIEFFKTGKSPDRGISAKEFRAWLDGWTPECFDLTSVAAKFNHPKGLALAPATLGLEANVSVVKLT